VQLVRIQSHGQNLARSCEKQFLLTVDAKADFPEAAQLEIDLTERLLQHFTG